MKSLDFKATFKVYGQLSLHFLWRLIQLGLHEVGNNAQNEVGKNEWEPSMKIIFNGIFQLYHRFSNTKLSNYMWIISWHCSSILGNSSEIIFPKICCWKSEKIQINPEIFFHLIVSLFFSKWGLFLGVWISVCLFVFVPLKNREINNSMPKYKLQLLHPISSDFINPAIPKSDNSAFLDE